MNHSTSIMVVAQPDHPCYMNLIKHYKVRTIDEAINTFESYDLVIDLSPLRTQKKFLFIKELSKTTKAQIISDLSLCWGEWIIKYCPQVTAAISTLFYSPQNAGEYFLKNTDDLNLQNVLMEFSSVADLKLIPVKNVELGFHYPRTISMIVNEAYFALGEKLATASDIDLAMKNGVNYPLGPIEWGEKIGLSLIAQLLDEYHTVTKDDRYRLSTHLKLHSLKNL